MHHVDVLMTFHASRPKAITFGVRNAPACKAPSRPRAVGPKAIMFGVRNAPSSLERITGSISPKAITFGVRDAPVKTA